MTPPARWTSWSGLASAVPAQRLAPQDVEQVVDAVLAARRNGLRVRMVGSGHSFTDVAVTDGLLLDPCGLVGLDSVDREAGTVTVRAGTPLHVLNAGLDAHGLALHNLGDIDRQTVAGAVSTGTHGAGGQRASLSAQLSAVELVTADGEVVTASPDAEADLFQAARLGLGAVGVLTRLTFAVEDAFVLDATERPMSWQEMVSEYDAIVDAHDHVDMYWWPHTDRCLAKLDDRVVGPTRPLPRVRSYVEDELLSNTLFGLVDRVCTRFPSVTPRASRLTSRGLPARRYRDVSHRVFVSRRRVVFREMEYALPREAGMTALTEVRRLIDREGWPVAWPVEVRCAPADDVWLSPAYQRESVYLAFHVGRGVDHRRYFGGVESVLRAYDGRPHWGKLHTRTAADLAPAYPRFGDFLAVRDKTDPDRLFGNAYLGRVLG
jgi:FAD-linked oxidoreductase